VPILSRLPRTDNLFFAFPCWKYDHHRENERGQNVPIFFYSPKGTIRPRRPYHRQMLMINDPSVHPSSKVLLGYPPTQCPFFGLVMPKAFMGRPFSFLSPQKTLSLLLLPPLTWPLILLGNQEQTWIKTERADPRGPTSKLVNTQVSSPSPSWKMLMRTPKNPHLSPHDDLLYYINDISTRGGPRPSQLPRF